MKNLTAVKWPGKRSDLFNQANWVNKPVLYSVLIAVALTGCDMDDQTKGSPEAVSSEPPSNQTAPATKTSPEGSDQDTTATYVSAISHIRADDGYSALGEIRFSQEANGLRITGELIGLSPGQHGFHVHEFGDCSAPDGKLAGGHFAPNDNRHGGPQDSVDQRHAGDLGNILADKNGRSSVDILNTELKVFQGPKAIIGKSVIVHAGSDDFSSQPSGDAGARVGCGVIEQAPQSWQEQ